MGTVWKRVLSEDEEEGLGRPVSPIKCERGSGDDGDMVEVVEGEEEGAEGEG